MKVTMILILACGLGMVPKGIGNLRKNQDHTDNSIVKVGKNIGRILET